MQNLRTPQLPFQRPVLDCLRHVRRCDVGVSAEVGDGADDFEKTIVRPRREPQLLDRGPEERFDLIGGLAICPRFMSEVPIPPLFPISR